MLVLPFYISTGVWNRLDDVRVCVYTSSVVNYVLESRSVQTNDYKIGMCCLCAKHVSREQGLSLLGGSIICPGCMDMSTS